VDSLGPSLCTSGSPMCLLVSLSRTAPRFRHYQPFGQNITGLVPSGTRWWPHHKCGWCGLARLTSPVEYNNSACKHRVVRGMQTSLNNGLKPRASAYECGLTNLSTLQSTYANHQVIFKPYACGEHKCGATTPLYLSLALPSLKWSVGAGIYL
jgi:hypothetical protein